MLRTTTYFDGRPDARFFMADIDGLIVSVRENLPTYAVTDGEVWIACRIHARCIERRWESTRIARRELGRFVRASLGSCVDTTTIGVWIPIEREEYAIGCPVCAAPRSQPCVDASAQSLPDRGAWLSVIGAPYKPEAHQVAVTPRPFIHAGRSTAHYQSLRGMPARRDDLRLCGDPHE